MDEKIKTVNISRTVAVGSVFSAGLGAACCIGPALFALLGIGSAGFLSSTMKFHVPFLVLSVAFLGAAFYFAYRKPKECADGCELPARKKWNRIFVWIAAGLWVFFTGFPYLR